VDRDSLADLPADSRREVVAEVCAVLDVEATTAEEPRAKGKLRSVWNWVFSTRARTLAAGIVGFVTIVGTVFGILDSVSVFNSSSSNPWPGGMAEFHNKAGLDVAKQC
jgi:hypothetical protein